MTTASTKQGNIALATNASKTVAEAHPTVSPPRRPGKRIHRLDMADWTILTALQNDARITYTALCRSMKTAPRTCIKRIGALEKNKHIRGYHAKLDAKKLNFDVVAFLCVGLSEQNEAGRRPLEDLIKNCPIVRECYVLTGASDFILKCVATDITALQNFLTDELMKMPDVRTVKTMVVMRSAKSEPDVPLPTFRGMTVAALPNRPATPPPLGAAAMTKETNQGASASREIRSREIRETV